MKLISQGSIYLSMIEAIIFLEKNTKILSKLLTFIRKALMFSTITKLFWCFIIQIKHYNCFDWDWRKQKTEKMFTWCFKSTSFFTAFNMWFQVSIKIPLISKSPITWSTMQFLLIWSMVHVWSALESMAVKRLELRKIIWKKKLTFFYLWKGFALANLPHIPGL